MASMRVRIPFLLENSALASSTLLVKCLSTTCIVSVIAFFPYDLSRTPYRCPPPPHTHNRPGSSGQTSLVAATSQSVRFARSLATRFQSGQPHLHTCVCPLMFDGGRGGGNARARWSLARRTYPNTLSSTSSPSGSRSVRHALTTNKRTTPKLIPSMHCQIHNSYDDFTLRTYMDIASYDNRLQSFPVGSFT